MRALAAYIMRGQLQAVTTVTACAVLALVLMPLSWPIGYLSAAGVGLVTLVQGPAEGGKTVLGATVLQAVIGMVAMGSPALAMSFALSLWLPTWVLAVVLVNSRSLLLPIQVLLALGIVAVAVIYVLMGEPGLWWYNHFMNDIVPMLEKAGVNVQRGQVLEQYLTSIAKMMTGMVVMFTAWGMLVGLLIARWWQAMLYRPGAFGEEFRTLSLGKIIAAAAVVLVVIATLAEGLLLELAGNMLLVMFGILLIQGLAVVHALVAHYKAHHIWLVVLYMMLVFLVPYMPVMLAMAGLIDNWANIRKRFQVQA